MVAVVPIHERGAVARGSADLATFGTIYHLGLAG